MKISLKKAHKLVGDIRRVPQPTPSKIVFPQTIASLEDLKVKTKEYDEAYVEFIKNAMTLNDIIAKIRHTIAVANAETKDGYGRSILELMAEIAHTRSQMDRLSSFSVKAKRTVDNTEVLYNTIVAGQRNENLAQPSIHLSGVSHLPEETCNCFFKKHKELTENHDAMRDTLTALNSSKEITIELTEEEVSLLDSYGLI